MKKIQGEPVPVIETRRLQLRGFTNDDLNALAEIYADPDVMRYMPGGKPVPRERVAASLGRMMDYWQEHGFGLWAAEDKESGRLIEVGAMRPAARWSVWGVDVAEPGAAAGLRRTGRQGAPV
jgi:RimJ/RimL family protein N-acetyltransferase